MDYYCWATLMMSYRTNDIIGGMVKKGYVVSPATSDGQIVHSLKERSGSHLFVIKVSSEKKTSAKAVGVDFQNIINNLGLKYYSLLTMERSDAFFTKTNIVLPDDSTTPTQPAME